MSFLKFFRRKPRQYKISINAQNIHTLHIGINAYKRSPLKLCVNDVTAVKQRFQEWGISPKNMVTLLDNTANTKNIKQALNDLERRAKPHDYVIIQYSGHGSQLPCVGEVDGKMEILCPVDIDLDFEKNHISDDFVGSVLTRLTARNITTYLLVDCCHTGGMTRTLSNETTLYNATRYLEAPQYAQYRDARTYRNSEFAETNKVVMLGGCEAHEVSYEYSIARHGALTWAFLEETKQNGLAETPLEIYNRVSQKVTKIFSGQHPVLEGKQELFTKQFFS